MINLRFIVSSLTKLKKPQVVELEAFFYAFYRTFAYNLVFLKVKPKSLSWYSFFFKT